MESTFSYFLECLKVNILDFQKALLGSVPHFSQILPFSGFFIPLYDYHLIPETDEEKLFNLKLAFKYIDEVKVEHRARPSEILTGDLKSVLRLVYALFEKYEVPRKGEDENNENDGNWKK